jgi:hypothetical protein
MAINDSGGASYGGATALGTVDAILKEVYESRVRDQLNDEVVALRRIERTSEGVTSQVGGKYVVFPIHVARNSGIGARLEDEDLPTPGAQGYRRAQVGLRYQYGRLRLTGQTIELARENFQAFASAMDEEVRRLKDDLAKDLNRQVYGDGLGAVATISGALAGSTAPVADTLYVQEGMLVDTGTVSNGVFTAVATNKVVSNVDVGNGTVDLTGGSGTPASGHVIVRAGNGRTAADEQREWTGLGALVGTGELFGVTHPKWASVIDNNGGTPRPLSESLLILNADAVRANGSYPTVMFMNLGVRRQYFNLLTQQRRYTNTQTFEGGFSGLAFTTDKGDIPMVVDTDAPKNTIYGLNEKEIKVYRDADWSFMDRDGSRWARVPNRDAYEATMYQYSELGTHRRNAHFVIKDITE